MPAWNDLSTWLKTQLLVMALDQWQLQTFTVHLHGGLVAKSTIEGRDLRSVVRDRIRKKLSKALGRKAEFFFVVEGWSKRTKTKTQLHIHGGAFMLEAQEGPIILSAVGKACGQGLRGSKPEARSIHGKVYWRDGETYVNYIFKSVKRPDDRLERRRNHMSREAVGAAREFWLLLTAPR
ncbi:MAG: hypothetical protein EBR34_02735 [Sphingomonadaceae bacterium]|nr:hypothetical protein [Sphingomonadaceae bacterium]